ncbi:MULTISPECIES: hypothetical protein [unclassified Streptomyces]|uniref:hypothetical protein n=1 Tax=unclassified Streptomyces TaxID=2593676 RepID=UPI00225086CF|nr:MULTISPECIES: hypothetical protein [unclassified Streptomyces]MCX5142324.1 hypothetical protein [Streptomyces sp. NBC_00338]WRZ66778.1 hypothetical protein OG408_24185 [Streptomyces sp. NBC_01257]
MSTPVPPPNQPYDGQPQAGNPYAAQPGQPGAPTGNPFAGQQPVGAPFGGGAPFAPVAPARNNVGLGIAAAVVAAVVAAAIYGAIIGATKHEIGYAAVGVGFVVGFASGKVGGRNPILPVLSVVLSLIAVYFGQLLGEAMIAAKELPVTVSELFFDHFSLLNEAWKADSDFISYLFFAVAAVAAFSGAKKAAD